jgi:nitrogen fixation NifU-like protein
VSEADAPDGAAALTALYRETIRRHAAEPTGFQRPIEATHTQEAYNALCGDRVAVRLQVADGTIEEAAFDGEACAICTASASMLCALAPGESIAQLRQWASELAATLQRPVGARSARESPSENLRAQSALPQPGNSQLPDELQPLLGVRPYPSRVRCATLPWEAAVAALDDT